MKQKLDDLYQLYAKLGYHNDAHLKYVVTLLETVYYKKN